jgi:uncharacterized phage protein (TIGR01671 family)
MMSREIKFRAWDDFNKEMIPYLSIDNQGWIFSSATNSPFVMQFTGLLDRDGKEIYEGDILRCDDGDGWETGVGVVGFIDGSFMVKDLECDAAGSINTSCESVVGNIYENPELLTP